MICERCRIREANIQYTEVIGGVRKEHNFCSQCAKELDLGSYSAIFDSDFPLGKLLSGLLGVIGEEEKGEVPQIVCPTCKTSYEEFVKNSRFGCPDCYGVFDLLISENIRKLQGSNTHKGKRPVQIRSRRSAGTFGAVEAQNEAISQGDLAPESKRTITGDDGQVTQPSDTQTENVQYTSESESVCADNAESSQLSSARAAANDVVRRAAASVSGHSPLSTSEQIRILEARLKEALQLEEYQIAAQCRDEIRKLRGDDGK